MKKIIYLFILFFSVSNMAAQKIVGGGLSYKVALLESDAFFVTINQVNLHGFYQLNNMGNSGEREFYVGAELSIPNNFIVEYNNDSFLKRLFQFTLSIKSLNYLTGDDESRISLNHYYQLSIPFTYIGTKSANSAPSSIKYNDGFHVGATFEYGAGLRLYINSSLAIYPSLGLNLGVLSLGGLINTDKSIIPYANVNFLVKGVYTLSD